VLVLCICGRIGNVLGGHLYGIIWEYISSLMRIGYVPSKYGEHDNGTDRNYFLWKINSGYYVDGDTER